MPKIKIIAKPDLKSATILKAAEMNSIHFGGNGTVIGGR